MSEQKTPLLLIVDMSALAFRSHYAMMRRPLKRPDGMVTSALFGMSQSLVSVIQEFSPTHVLCALDAREKSFRNTLYPEYKAHRPECPPELAAQLEMQEELADAFGFACSKHPGFEADDIIGAYVKVGQAKGWDVLIYSSDKDFMQLLDDKTKMLISHKGGESEILGADGVEDKLGVKAHQVADFLALMGDSADNIPGAPGVGKVTAAKLLAEFESLENLLEKSDQITKKGLAAKIQDNVEQIQLSRKLVELCYDIPEVYEEGELTFKGFEKERLSPFIEKMAFPKIMSRIQAMGDDEPSEPLVSLGEKVTSQWIEALDDVCAELDGVPEGTPIAFHWEELDGQIDGLSICWGESSPMLYKSTALKIEDWARFFTNLSSKTVVVMNAKALMGKVNAFGLSCPHLHDLFLMESVAHQSGREVSLSSLAKNLLEATLKDFGKKGNKKKGYADLDALEEELYLREHVLAIQQLYTHLKETMDSREVMPVYENLERPLLNVISKMEQAGIALEKEPLLEQSLTCAEELEVLTAEIYELSGETFNIQSPQQLGIVLFDKMKIQDELGLKKVKKTKTGYSTDAKVLESIKAHPIGDKLLRYRFLSKLKSTYLDALPKQCLPQTGRLHTTYHQNGTATGRLSSQDPNLQNIPMRVPEGAQIRRAFVANSADRVLLAADYSQIELRVLAHYSRDEVMLEAFRSGMDIHTATAAKVHLCSESEVTREMRSSAKAVNFGLLYGMGPKLLSEQTNLSFGEAQKFIKTYFKTFPSIRSFMLQQVEQARVAGGVKTISGRRRDLPELNSSNGMMRSAAENMALNTPIQGSAADLIKWAMLRLQAKIEAEALPMALLLQVHDELVFEVQRDRVEELEAVIRVEMERVDQLPIDFLVPLKVDIGVGEHWLDAH